MGLGADIEDVRGLKKGDEKVSAFANRDVKDSAETVHENGALAAVDGVERGVEGAGGDSEAEGGAGYVGEKRHRSLISHLGISRESV